MYGIHRLLYVCVALSLLAPTVSALAVEAHQRLAAHHAESVAGATGHSHGHGHDHAHDAAHRHVAGHGHAHDAGGGHRHARPSAHLHEASADGHSVPGHSVHGPSAHEPHEHPTRETGDGVVTARDRGPAMPLLAAQVQIEIARPDVLCVPAAQSARGVGPPAEPGLVPYLHCSLQI